MGITDRLRELVSLNSSSDRAFALRCGLKQTTFDKQMRGTRALSLDTVEAVLSTFGDISAEWLIRGEGQMMLNAPAPSPDYEKINKLVDTITTLQDTINEKDKTIRALTEQINQLKNQIK